MGHILVEEMELFPVSVVRFVLTLMILQTSL